MESIKSTHPTLKITGRVLRVDDIDIIIIIVAINLTCANLISSDFAFRFGDSKYQKSSVLFWQNVEW